LKNPWNILDFLIIIFGIAEWIFPYSKTVTDMKILRALRPLKGINQVQQLKRLVNTLLTALPNLGSVGLFMSFFIFIFAVTGLHLFQGHYYTRCRLTEFPLNSTYWPIDISQPRSCNGHFGNYECDVGTFCGHMNDMNLPITNDPIVNNERIQYGVGTFDNFWQASLAVIQIITFDNWTIVMQFIIDSSDYYVGAVFCIVIVIICSFFLLNLILAVIMQSFSVLHKKDLFLKMDEEKRELIEKIRRKRKEQRMKKKRLEEEDKTLMYKTLGIE
jgi:hypothetical protein